MRQKIYTFLSLMIVWIIFAGKLTWDVFLVGGAASLLVSYFFSDMLFRKMSLDNNVFTHLKKFCLIIAFIPVFFYEAFIAALKVSRYAFSRKLDLNPGIIKVKTHLIDVTAITLLANLITLTPGTLTVDFDKSERCYYIHWLDVETKEEAETRKALLGRFEKWLEVIYH